MSRVPGAEAARVYAAAERFVDRALRRNGSIFSSRRRWAPEVLDDLRHLWLTLVQQGFTFVDLVDVR